MQGCTPWHGFFIALAANHRSHLDPPNMPTPDEINDAIADNATGPKSISVGGESISEHSIPDQIAAANHLANQQAATRSHLGMRIVGIRGPGAWE